MAEYVSVIIRVSAAVNDGLFEKIKEESTMSEAIRRLFRKEIAEESKEQLEAVALRMLQDHESIDKIRKYTNISADRIIAIAKANGMNIQAV